MAFNRVTMGFIYDEGVDLPPIQHHQKKNVQIKKYIRNKTKKKRKKEKDTTKTRNTQLR